MDKFNFPNGYEVDIVRKKDVLDAIDNNIIDKDIALAVITNCEYNCARLLEEGKWAGIPFIGNFRPRETKLTLASTENVELLQTAKENLSKEDYVIFRKDLVRDAAIRTKNTRFLRYEASKIAIKNKRLYKELITNRGGAVAAILMYSFKKFTTISESKLEIEQ